MAVVVIGVDPAKRSHMVEVLDAAEARLAAGRFGNDNDGYRQMRALGRRWPARVWAVEGASGVGLQLAQRLVADSLMTAKAGGATGSARTTSGRSRRAVGGRRSYC